MLVNFVPSHTGFTLCWTLLVLLSGHDHGQYLFTELLRQHVLAYRMCLLQIVHIYVRLSDILFLLIDRRAIPLDRSNVAVDVTASLAR